MQWLKIQLVYWPTLRWNVLLGRWLKLREWWSFIDERLILGALPYRRDVATLKELGVTAVVNTCREYRGPLKHYEKFGIEQLHMPTIDFTHPSLDDVCRAVEFIQQHRQNGGAVYVHCKAGRARSATVVLCWLCKYGNLSAEEAQQLLLFKRGHVNPHIKDRPVVREFLKLIRDSQA